MIVYNNIQPLECSTAVALGHFDGIHKGHRLVIGNAVKCRQKGLSPAVVTFSQNPVSVITGKKIPYLTDSSSKQRYMEELGVEHMFSLDFTKIMNMSAQDFVSQVLHKQLNAKRVYCGFNYHLAAAAQPTAKHCVTCAVNMTLRWFHFRRQCITTSL